MIFNVGDIVAANELSDRYYSVTSCRQKCIARVTRIMDPDLMEIEVLENTNRTALHNRFAVHPECFDLFSRRETILDIDESLFDFIAFDSNGKTIKRFSKRGVLNGEYKTIHDAASANNISETQIIKCIKGSYKTAGGYSWSSS